MALANLAPRSLKVAIGKVAKSTTKNSKKQEVLPQDLHTIIQLKAYEIYQQRGCEHGLDVDDWIKAETLIKSKA